MRWLSSVMARIILISAVSRSSYGLIDISPLLVGLDFESAIDQFNPPSRQP